MRQKKKRWRQSTTAVILAFTLIVTMLPTISANAMSPSESYLAADPSDQPVSDGNKDRLWHKFPVDATLPSSGQNASAHPWSQQAWLLGNGKLGTFMYGDPDRERIHINEKTLWKGGKQDPTNPADTYEGGNRTAANATTKANLDAFRTVLDTKTANVFGGAFATINSQLSTLMAPSGTARMQGYNDFGNMYMEFDGIPKYSQNDTIKNSYVRSLDMDTGISYVNFDYDGTHYKRESFDSHPDKVGVTNLTATQGSGRLNFNLYLTDEEMNGTRVENLTTTGDVAAGTVTMQFNLTDNKLKAAMQVKVLTDGTLSPYTKASFTFPGTAGTNGRVGGPYNGLTITGATWATLVYVTDTDYKNAYPNYRTGESSAQLLTRIAGVVNTAAAKGFAALRVAHIADHSGLYNRVKVDLDTVCPSIPTDELVRNYRNGDYNRVMEEQVYQIGRYLTIAGSRAGDPLPTNLCGIWMVGNHSTYWNADFHFNINVQMNYWPTMQANLAESMIPFNDYVESLVQPGRLTALRSYAINDPAEPGYDAQYDTAFSNLSTYPVGEGRGFLVNTVNNPYGFTTPASSQEWGYNVGGMAWSLLNLYEYYQFTGDETFLQNTLYPMLKETAKFYDQYLWRSPYQNRLVVSPSVSAEHGPTVNGSTYDQSIAWELYKMAIASSEKLSVDAGLRATWKANQTDLKPVMYGSEGQIKEWFEETRLGFAQAGSLPETQIPAWQPSLPGEHRHANHLFGLYPGTLINNNNQADMDAAMVSLINRGFEATGWSKAWKLNMWARTGDAENTYKLLRSMNSGYFAGMLENLLDSHPPFQIDGNYGYTAGMQEMLMQSQNGYVQFLPTLPQAWNTGSVKGFVARGNFVVDMDWSNGTANSFTIQSNKGKTFVGEYPKISNALVIESDGDGSNPVKVTPTKVDADRISFPTTAGKTYTITFNPASGNEGGIGAAPQKLLDTITAAKDLAATMQDGRLAPAKTLLHNGIALASTASVDPTLKDYTAAINALNREINKAKGAMNLLDTILDGEALISDASVGTLPWEYTRTEMDAFRGMVDVSEKVLADTVEATTVNEYNTEATKLSREIAITRERTDALKVAISQSGNALVISSVYSGVAEIRYTLDGSEPNQYANIYKSPATLNNGATIKAALYYQGKRLGPVTEYLYRNQSHNIALAYDSITATNATTGTNGMANRMVDGSTTTQWQSVAVSAGNGAYNSVVDITFADPVTVNMSRILRSTGNYWIVKFDLQYKTAGVWLNAYSYDGPTTIDDSTFEFPTFTAKEIRLNIRYGWGPRIAEWELYGPVQELNIDKSAIDTQLQVAQKAITRGVRPDPGTPPAKPTEEEKAFMDAVQYGKAVAVNAYADLITVSDAKDKLAAVLTAQNLYDAEDKSALLSAVNAASALILTDYDADSLVAAFSAALDEARTVLYNQSVLQSEVNDAAGALQTAQAAMIATKKDRTVLNSVVEAGKQVRSKLYAGAYLSSNTEAFEAALQAAIDLQSLPTAKQAQMNAAAIKLLGAIDKLIPQAAGTDKNHLSDQVSKGGEVYDKGIAGLLSPQELAEFEAAYEDATLILYHPYASQSQIEAAQNELKTVMDGLGLLPADKTAIENAVNSGNSLRLTDYDDATLVYAYQRALEQAGAVKADPNAWQIEADVALAKLTAARTAMVATAKDRVPLTAKIAELKNMTADVASGNYVEADIRRLASAIEKASAILNDVASNQALLNAALANLEDAQATLRLVANKAALTSTITKAELVNLTGYSDGSVETFNAALKAAREIAQNPNLSVDEQGIVDSVNANLEQAMRRLETAGASGGDSKTDLTAATFTITNAVWTGRQIKPAFTVKLGKQSLTSGTDYSISYGSNKNIGLGTVTVTGKGSYTGKVSATFKILPKETVITKARAGSKNVRVTWKKVSAQQKITQYQLRYRVKGASKWTTKTVSAKATSLTIKNLKKGKTCQFQVRACKTVSKVNYYSAWSKTKTSGAVK
jgi:alpha-L-fucosidase 2